MGISMPGDDEIRLGRRLEGEPPRRVSFSLALSNMRDEAGAARFTVGYNLLLFNTVSLENLIRATVMPKEKLLKELKFYQKEFGLRGNQKKGYRLSKDLEKQVEMAAAVSELINGPR